jgi:hypothetical protein
MRAEHKGRVVDNFWEWECVPLNVVSKEEYDKAT